MSTSPYAPLVFWTLGVRDSPNRAASTFALARAVTPQLVALALESPSVSRAVSVVPEARRHNTVGALAVIAGNRHLRHSWKVPLGTGLSSHPGSNLTPLLGLVPAATQVNAATILGSTLKRAGRRTAVDLVEFVTLLTDWDELDLRARSAFLIDFHTADRA